MPPRHRRRRSPRTPTAPASARASGWKRGRHLRSGYACSLLLRKSAPCNTSLVPLCLDRRRLDLLHRLRETWRADPVREHRVGVLGDVALDLLPVVVVGADPFAVAADR